MKLHLVTILGISFIFGFWEPAICSSKTNLKTEKDKISYTLGLNIGKAFRKEGIAVAPELVLQGIKDGLSGNAQLSQEEALAIMKDLFKKTKAKAQQKLLQDPKIRKHLMSAMRKGMRQGARPAEGKKRSELADLNLKNSNAYLAENKNQKNIIELPSGLQYKIIRSGNGRSPKRTDVVSIHYSGHFINNTEFDSTYKKNKPSVFRVNKAIVGWSEALPKMKIGAKWRLFVPPHLAFGENGSGDTIGPNTTLIFDIELISIEPSS